MENNDQLNNPADTTTPNKTQHIFFTRKQLITGGTITIAVIAGLLIWKAIQINNVKKNAKAQEEVLINQYHNLHLQQNADFLRKLAKPYVWAIRNEMMQNNTRQVNLYNNDIVKEKNFIAVMIADEKGFILSSSDKKYEGKSILILQPPINANADSTVVNRVNDSLLVMSSPIMSFNSRMGTLIITYSVEKPGILKNRQ